MNAKLSKAALVTYRSAVLCAVGAMTWLSGNFVTKEKFHDYVHAHEKWGGAVIQRLDGNTADIKRGVDQLNQKVDALLTTRRVGIDAAMGKPKTP